MSESLFDQLAKIAPFLRTMCSSNDAKVSYDMAAEALVWNDEIPKTEAVKIRELWCLRPVLRYRTSVILNCPEEEHRAVWEEAQRLFPEWPAFLSGRRSTKLADTFLSLQTQAEQGYNALPD